MKKYFATGLIILLPLVLTIAIVTFLVNFLTGPFIGMLESLISTQHWDEILKDIPGSRQILHYGSKVVVLIILFFITVLLGMITRWFFFKSILHYGDKLLHRIPLVNKLYKTSQDIISTIFSSKADSFKKVVMVPFPNRSTYSIGLVSSDAPPSCKAAAKRDLISVFVPTTPNPTSGYLLMFPREDCIFLDMKVEDGIKFIISCGVIHEGAPDHSPIKPPPMTDGEVEVAD